MKRLFTTGTTEHVPSPKKADRGIDHFQAIVDSGLFRLPEDRDDRAFVMRNIEKISETRVGTELMLRIRKALAKSGVMVNIRIGDDFSYDHATHTVNLLRNDIAYFRNPDHPDHPSYLQFSPRTADSSLFHELVHMLHQQEDIVGYSSRLVHSFRDKDPYKDYHNAEELATITGLTRCMLGYKRDEVNENAYLRERGVSPRMDHIGWTHEDMYTVVKSCITVTTDPTKLVLFLTNLRGAIKGGAIDQEAAKELVRLSQENPLVSSIVRGELQHAGLISPEEIAELTTPQILALMTSA